MSEPVIVKERSKDQEGGKYTQDVMTSRHHLTADEPESFGSADLGPTPFEYLCAALGACTTITMRMYIERKGWAVDHLACEVSHTKTTIGDLPPKDVFTRVITIKDDLDGAARKRILVIAGKCPVHKTLHSSSEIETHLAE